MTFSPDDAPRPVDMRCFATRFRERVRELAPEVRARIGTCAERKPADRAFFNDPSVQRALG